jgi:hypothetical protein
MQVSQVFASGFSTGHDDHAKDDWRRPHHRRGHWVSWRDRRGHWHRGWHWDD